MYWTYLRRELSGRKKQTIIVAIGMAIAIALVIVVTSLSSGVRDAQAQALASVYGVGTDLTVTGAQAEPGEGGRGPQFEFDDDGGQTDGDGTTTLSQSRLMTDFMRATLDQSAVETVAATEGVAAASGALSLTNTTFDGELPSPPSDATGDESGERPQPGEGDSMQGGFGGGSFDIESFSVLGIEPAAAGETPVGPLSSVEVTDGRALSADDAGTEVAVLDESYAAGAEVAVGDAIDVGGAEFTVVGIVASTSSSADTAADVYVPLDVAQELSGAGEVVSTIYVQADSADAIGDLRGSLEDALPDATVSSQSDLASTVSSSLSSASALITNLGTWLSVIVLVVAVALAVLFTMSGISRRTRELGTLKAIGWSNRRIVGQVTGESVVQTLIGGAVGIAVGLVGVWIVNLVEPTISAASTADPSAMTPGGMRGPGGFGAATAAAASDVVLHAPLSLWLVALAVALAVGGGLVAGAFGGWRAARLSPAEALRAVA